MRTTRAHSISLKSLLLALCLVGSVLAADDTTVQSPESILETAKAFLENAARTQHAGRIEVKMGYLDARLRLARCDQKLEAFQAPGARLGGHSSVGVRCPGPSGWTIYVSADIDFFGKALVATRPLTRGAALTADNVKLVETDLSALGQGYLQRLEDIDGMVARRTVPVGAVLTPAMVKAPHLVERGDRVRLVSDQGPIQVEMMGEAINAGARGERIRVRALNSQRIVEGWVVSASVVKVTL